MKSAMKPALWIGCLVLVTCACSEDSQNNTSADTSASAADAADSTQEEVLVIGDDLSGGNDTSSAVNPKLAEAWPFNEGVEDAPVTITEASGVFTAEIDAAAGGLDASRTHAFIYLDLDAAEKLAIDDFQAAENKVWDLAFKRTVIRSNGADSGPGDIQVGRITDQAFDAITAVPSNLIFAQDVSFDVDGNLLADPIGQPKTAFNYLNSDTTSGSWYDYGASIGPVPGHVYIIQDSKTQTAFKFEIQAWTSGQYTVRWAKL